MTEPTDDQISLSIVWPDVNDVPVHVANQMVTQIGVAADGQTPEAIIVTLGHVAPPFVLGSPEDQRAMLRAMGGIPSRTLGRFYFTRERAEEVAHLLLGAVATYDGLAGGGGPRA